MVQMKVSYLKEKNCELRHGPSGQVITTDAPLDNQGRGQSFSPTDLCSVSLASCMLTVMAIAGEKAGLDFQGSWAEVTKEMKTNPRRIGRLVVRLHLPTRFTAEWRERLQSIAMDCPVKHSLHPSIETVIDFQFDVAGVD